MRNADNKSILVTRHARKRIKERCGVGKKSAPRVCHLIEQRGIYRVQTKGQLRKWLDERVRPGTDIMVYGDKAYIIALAEAEDQCNRLVTVLQLPPKITQHKKRMIIAA